MNKTGDTQDTSVEQERQETIPNLSQGNTSGRPTKYDPVFIIKAQEYIDTVLEDRKKSRTLPTIEGFARFIGVDPDSINNWSKKVLKDENGNKTNKLARPEFFGAIKRIKTLQKELLMTDGLYGGKEVNSIMAMFLLKTNHSMIEESHVDHTTKGEKLSSQVVGFIYNTPIPNDESNNTGNQSNA